ncbi:hypothetical protein D3C85_666700 [compost metagenome]
MKVKGFYVLEHKPTGQVYTGVSTDAEKEVKDLLASLTTATCTNKRLVGLYKRDPDFKYRVTPFAAIPDARAFEKKFRAHIPDHLLIN